jgi:hypothetical protein
LLCALIMRIAALAAAVVFTACMPFAHATDEGNRPPIEQLVEPNPDIRSRDLFYGVGGRANAPRTDVAYEFRRSDHRGESLNFDVVDPSGRKWDAKFGADARPEVAASRLLYAIGFRQPAVYYVREWRIEGGKQAGVQQPARFRLKAGKKDGEWAWKDNPFVGTREMNGLIVMMALLNNWDLKTSNNMIYERRGKSPELIYVVKDLGDSFGATPHLTFRGTHDDLDGFKKERFIERVKDGRVDLYYTPLFLNMGIANDLSIEDVLWTCRRLDQLSDRQWRDAFRSAGYGDEEASQFIEHLRSKVAEGLALADHRQA